MKPDRNRCLFNGDCNFLFANDYGRVPGRRYSAEVIRDYVDRLADSGVDTYLINPNGQVPWYPSRRLAHVLTGYRRGDRAYVRGHFPPVSESFTDEQLDRCLTTTTAMLDRYLDLAEDGTDWFREAVEACRRRGVAPWASIRMNDAHGANSWEHSYFNSPLQKDPRYRLSGRGLNPAHGPQNGLMVMNYERPEVRAYMADLIREAIEDYGCEGLELDWWRIPACCEPPATEAAIADMLAWMGEIRAVTERRAAALGRPVPLGLRIPCRLDHLRTIGLDVAGMARRGLIDFVSASNMWQTTWDVEYGRLREALGSEVALYGVIEDAPNWMFAATESGKAGFRLLSTSPELLRGNAANKWATGADGIELFNFFCSDAKILRQRKDGEPVVARYPEIASLRSLPALRGTRKHYTLSTGYGYWLFRFFEQAEQLPAWIEPGGWTRFGLGLCAEPADMVLVAQVVVDRATGAPELGLSLNGSWPAFERRETDRLLAPTGAHVRHLPEHRAFEYRLDAARLRDGVNEIILYHGSEDTDPRRRDLSGSVRVVGLELLVTPG